MQQNERTVRIIGSQHKLESPQCEAVTSKIATAPGRENGKKSSLGIQVEKGKRLLININKSVSQSICSSLRGLSSQTSRMWCIILANVTPAVMTVLGQLVHFGNMLWHYHQEFSKCRSISWKMWLHTIKWKGADSAQEQIANLEIMTI